MHFPLLCTSSTLDCTCAEILKISKQPKSIFKLYGNSTNLKIAKKKLCCCNHHNRPLSVLSNAHTPWIAILIQYPLNRGDLCFEFWALHCALCVFLQYKSTFWQWKFNWIQLYLLCLKNSKNIKLHHFSLKMYWIYPIKYPCNTLYFSKLSWRIQ